MTERERDEKRKDGTGLSNKVNEEQRTPQVQTPDKPSQAEGDRETMEESIEEKESQGEL